MHLLKLTFAMICRPDSNNICNPRVAITDAKTTMPCKITHLRIKLHNEDSYFYVIDHKSIITTFTPPTSTHGLFFFRIKRTSLTIKIITKGKDK